MRGLDGFSRKEGVPRKDLAMAALGLKTDNISPRQRKQDDTEDIQLSAKELAAAKALEPVNKTLDEVEEELIPVTAIPPGLKVGKLTLHPTSVAEIPQNIPDNLEIHWTEPPDEEDGKSNHE